MVVLAEIGFVVEQQLLGDGLGVGAALGEGVERTSAQRILAQDAGFTVVVCLLDVILLCTVAQRGSENCRDLEVLEGGNIHGELAVEGITLGVVETARIESCKGIGAVVSGAPGAVGPDGAVDGVVFERSLYGVDLVVVGQLVVESDVYGCREELVEFDVVVQPGGVLLHVTSVVEGVFVLVGEHGAALDILVAVGDANAVLVLGSPFLDHQSIPVCEGVGVGVELMVGEVVLNVVFIVLVVVAALGVACVVPLALVLELHETLGAHLLGVAGTGEHAEGAVVVDAQLAFLGTLGGDEDHTCGCTGTVDGGGGRILQHGDVLYGVHVHVVDCAHGHAVHDHERVGVTDGGDTAHADGGCRARQAAGPRDLHAGHGALQGLAEADSLDGGQLAAVHRGHCAGEVFLLHGAVADDHDLVEEFGVCGHDDVDGRAPGNLLLDSFIANAGEFQHGLVGCHGNGVLSVGSGDGAVERALFEDAGTDHGETVFVRDGPGHLDLGLGREGHEAANQGGECN